MSYNVKKQCHVCHGNGFKVNDNLEKKQCSRCNGTGEPCEVRAKTNKRPAPKYKSKKDGIELLKFIDPI